MYYHLRINGRNSYRTRPVTTYKGDRHTVIIRHRTESYRVTQKHTKACARLRRARPQHERGGSLPRVWCAGWRATGPKVKLYLYRTGTIGLYHALGARPYVTVRHTRTKLTGLTRATRHEQHGTNMAWQQVSAGGHRSRRSPGDQSVNMPGRSTINPPPRRSHPRHWQGPSAALFSAASLVVPSRSLAAFFAWLPCSSSALQDHPWQRASFLALPPWVPHPPWDAGAA